MIIRKGMKYRLEPNTAQRAAMVMFAGHNRAVWNNALTLTKDDLSVKNILAAGHAVLACGVDALATTVKQEPVLVPC